MSQHISVFSEFPSVALATTIVWAANIFIEFTPAGTDQNILFEGSQYVFMAFSVTAGICAVLMMRIQQSATGQNHQRSPYLWTVGAGCIILISNNLLAGASLQEWRLLVIVSLLSASAFAVGINLARHKPINFEISTLILAAPYLIIVLASLGTELSSILGLLNDDLFKDQRYTPARWSHFNSYANGLGYDAWIAAIVCLALLASRSRQFRVVAFWFLLPLCIFVLLKSGTRAAFLALACSSYAYAIMQYGWKRGLAVGALIFCVMAVMAAFLTYHGLIDLVRFSGDINYMSSGRWDAYLTLLDIFLVSPIVGHGFGSMSYADLRIAPNLFYPSILAELGLLGVAGLMMIMFVPLRNIVTKATVLCRRQDQQENDSLMVLAFCLCPGVAVWLLFEFDLLRVSGNNQLIFLALGYLSGSSKLRTQD